MPEVPSHQPACHWYADGRIAILLLLMLCLSWLLSGAEHAKARWERLGVPARYPAFMDLAIFPAARATLADGGDPYLANHHDAWQRTYNYPRIWLLVMRFPADQTIIAALGTGLALAALAAWLVFLGPLSWPAGLYAGVLVCSPAVMLAVRQGNTDLLIFILLLAGIGLTALSFRPIWASAVWLLAAVFKLYPVLAFPAVVRRPFRRSWLMPAAALAVFGSYVVWNHVEVRHALGNTAAGWVVSYGARVPMRAAAMVVSYYKLGTLDEARLGLICTGLAFVVVMAGARVGWRIGWRAEQGDGMGDLAARIGFRAGTLVYIGTFVAGNNFDYRLVFLLLTPPWLWRIRRPSDPVGRLAVSCLVALPVALIPGYATAGWTGFTLHHIAGWWLCFGLGALVVADYAAESAPSTSESRAVAG